MDALSAAKVAAAGIAGAGGSGGAVYGTYYLVTSNKSSSKGEQSEEVKEVKQDKTIEEKKEELKKWMDTNKCVIKIEVTGGSNNPIDLKTGNPENDLINGFWTWWSNDTNKASLGCPGSSGTSSQDITVTTANKTQFNKKEQ